MVWLGDDFPEPHRGTLWLVRFGNLLARPADTGFDLLQARVRRNAAGAWEAGIETVLAPLGRPLDIHQSGRGRLYVLEYSRPLNHKDNLPMLPGRILELAVQP